MWEREIELIDNLGKLYPILKNGNKYEIYRENNYDKAWWAYRLCKNHLNRRIPRLERFIKNYSWYAWKWYKFRFNITDEQCGKKN